MDLCVYNPTLYSVTYTRNFISSLKTHPSFDYASTDLTRSIKEDSTLEVSLLVSDNIARAVKALIHEPNEEIMSVTAGYSHT
jgi:hypothetical protein